MSTGHSNVHSSIGQTKMSVGHTEMSIRPLDEQKCPVDIPMSIRPLDKQKCPFRHSNVHSFNGRVDIV